MNKLIQDMFAEEEARLLKIAGVVDNSMTLQRALGISDSDIERMRRMKSSRINCGKYDVVVEYRAHEGWMTLLEIVPRGSDSFNPRAPWVSPEDISGTCSINLAPKNVVDEVVAYIKNHD